MSGATRLRIITFIGLSSLSIALWAFSKPSGSEIELFDAVNRERNRHGLRSLKWDESLAAASAKACVGNAKAGRGPEPAQSIAHP